MCHTVEGGGAVIDIVIATAQVEIEDIDRVDLLDVFVVATQFHLLNNGFRRAKKDALHEMSLTGQLHLYDNVFTLVGLGLHIYTVQLVFFRILIALAFQHLGDSDGFADEHSHQSLQHFGIRLVSKDALDSPVESDIVSVVVHFSHCFSRAWVRFAAVRLQFDANLRLFLETCKKKP